MDRLIIMADDFTGTLDTGIQFAKTGVRTGVLTDPFFEFESVSEEAAVLAVNTDTRPLSGEEAYRRVFDLTKRAKSAGFNYFYKKTDSGLRGNIGAELTAAMEGLGAKRVFFIPALPKLNRTTVGGIQYIDGVPVSESVFGQDPFEPVRYDDVAEIIHTQSDVPVVKIPTVKGACLKDFSGKEPVIFLFDAVTQEDLEQIVEFVRETILDGIPSVIAGCAGFASVLDRVVHFERGGTGEVRRTKGLLALCGSVNRITIEQMAYAEGKGFTGRHIDNDRKLETLSESESEREIFYDEIYEAVSGCDRCLIDALNAPGEEDPFSYAERHGITIEQLRERICRTLGRIAKGLIDRGLDYTYSFTGGDTLMGFMNAVGARELTPVCEIGKGAVLSELTYKGKTVSVISKSGGFGGEDIFCEMYETATGRSVEEPCPKRRAVFLDRDGTLHVDKVETTLQKGLEIFPDAAPMLRELHERGYLCIVVTNQSGIGKGHITLEEMQELNSLLRVKLADAGGRIDGIYFCPHRKEEGCPCAKPGPGMLLRAAKEWNIDLTASYMVGDRIGDIRAAANAGIPADHRILVTTGIYPDGDFRNEEGLAELAPIVVESLADVTKIIE